MTTDAAVEAPAAEAAEAYGPAAAGLSGATTDPRYALLETDPQFDRHGNIRNPDAPDTTELGVDVNDGMWLHRDLFAHQFRWGFVGRLIRGGERILDMGCGSKMPLANTINFGLGSYLPELYVGVDYGTFNRATIGKTKPRKWEGNHRPNFDATLWPNVESVIQEYGQFDIVTSFEVVEHIFPAERVVDYYTNAWYALKPGGIMLTSTPIVEVNSKGQKVRARNHVHEFTAQELGAVVNACGFVVEERYGTFANYPDVKRAIKRDYPEQAEALLQIYERARSFYSDNVLACFLAPVFPLEARNQFLVLRKPE